MLSGNEVQPCCKRNQTCQTYNGIITWKIWLYKIYVEYSDVENTGSFLVNFATYDFLPCTCHLLDYPFLTCTNPDTVRGNFSSHLICHVQLPALYMSPDGFGFFGMYGCRHRTWHFFFSFDLPRTTSCLVRVVCWNIPF